MKEETKNLLYLILEIFFDLIIMAGTIYKYYNSSRSGFALGMMIVLLLVGVACIVYEVMRYIKTKKKGEEK